MHFKSKGWLLLIMNYKNISDTELRLLYSKINFIFNNISEIREHLDVIFIFGKEENEDKTPTNRKNLKDFIEKKQTNLKVLTIEELYTDLRKYVFTAKGPKKSFIQIAKLELMVIKNSFSMIIFPESPGSFAELGYFCAKDETREKILVLNHTDFYNRRSYVDSIIKLIYEGKDYDQILLGSKSDNECFEECINHLFDGYDKYEEEIYSKEIKNTHYMYGISVIFELIKIFPYLEYSELSYLVKHCFMKLKLEVEDLELYISSMVTLLVLSDLVERKTISDKILFIVKNQFFSCFKFKEFDEKKEFAIASIEFQIKQLKGIE